LKVSVLQLFRQVLYLDGLKETLCEFLFLNYPSALSAGYSAPVHGQTEQPSLFVTEPLTW
jgi:hypothetical protein